MRGFSVAVAEGSSSPKKNAPAVLFKASTREEQADRHRHASAIATKLRMDETDNLGIQKIRLARTSDCSCNDGDGGDSRPHTHHVTIVAIPDLKR